MSLDLKLFEQRKQEHIQLALDPKHQTEVKNCFDDFDLVHEAIPDLNFNDIDLRTRSLGHSKRTPFFISSMTAGHADAQKINNNLMAACQETGWAMGVGSQRRELFDSTSFEWPLLRKAYPAVSMMANIGIAQLIETPLTQLKKLVEVIQAEAFIVHCNPLQELIQPEGNVDFQGSWKAIEELVQKIQIPVVVKETGCGFSMKTLARLNQLGVHAIDVAGLGGTHWGRIEGSRALHYPQRARAAETFSNWGVSTANVLHQAKDLFLQAELWGSGGIRHGLDAAKAIRLGACQIGIARPVLAAALLDELAVIEVMRTYEYELKIAMFCTDSPSLKVLKQRPICFLSKEI